jgi:hypothetical protein
MDTAALIIVVGAAVVVGTVAFAAAWAADRRWRLPLPLYAFGLIGAVIGALAGYGVVGGWFDAVRWNEKIAVDKVLPYMATIRREEPQLYERLETSILRDQEEGKTPAEVRFNAKMFVRSYVQDKAVGLPDDLVYELYSALRDDIAYLWGQKKYQVCADFALGRFAGDIDAELSPELAERNLANTLRVITTDADPSMNRMESAEFQKQTAVWLGEASQATGVPPEDFDLLLRGGGDPAKACRVMKAFFDAALLQPVELAALALRTLSSGERL